MSYAADRSASRPHRTTQHPRCSCSKPMFICLVQMDRESYRRVSFTRQTASRTRCSNLGSSLCGYRFRVGVGDVVPSKNSGVVVRSISRFCQSRCDWICRRKMLIASKQQTSSSRRSVHVRVEYEPQRWFVRVQQWRRSFGTSRVVHIRSANRWRTSTKTPSGVARWFRSSWNVRYVACLMSSAP